MQPELLLKKITQKQKTVYPKINSILIEFNLPLRPPQIHDFREAILRCISDDGEREIFSNERVENGLRKTIVRYPLVQFRVRNGHAAIWAMQEAVPLVHRFMDKYRQKFTWQGRRVELLIAELPMETKDYPVRLLNSRLQQEPVIYRLYYYIPFSNDNKNKNYDWWKASRNLPDIEKTKRLEELLTNHLCSLVHYAGGFVPKQKIRLAILDKKLLEDVSFEGQPHVVFELRYLANLDLPDQVAIGNKCSHGFGWQRREA